MLKKILASIAILLVVLVGLLIAIPFLFKGQIMEFVKEEINKNVNATVDFSDVSLSLIRNFPDLCVDIQDLTIVGKGAFVSDTLADIENIRTVVNVKTLWNQDDIQLKGIRVDAPKIHAKILPNNKANWDIALPAEEGAVATETVYDVKLQRYEIRDADIFYEDLVGNMKVWLKGLTHFGKGDFTQDLFVLDTKTDIKGLTANMAGLNYLSKAQVKWDADLEVDNKAVKYTLKDNNLKINALDLDFDGWVQMPPNTGDMVMNLTFNAKQTDFKNLLSLLPSSYTDDFNNIKSAGKLALNGFAKGTYNETSLPGFNLDIDVIDGMFKYPDLPQSVDNIQLDVNLTNPDGVPDHTLIHLPKLTFEIDGDPFAITALVKNPESDPDMDLTAKGVIDLAKVMQSYPIEGVTKLTGRVNADLTAKGKQSAIDEERYEDFDVNGKLQIAKMIYEAVDLPKAVNITDLTLLFSPREVSLPNVDAKVGNSDFKASGKLSNFLAYSFGDGTLKGNLDITSKQFDVNEWMENAEAPPVADSIILGVFKVPPKMDLAANFKTDKLLYTNLTLKNTSGKLTVKDEAIRFTGMKTTLLGGSMGITGLYSTKDTEEPIVDFDFVINSFDIQEAFEKFNTVQALAPVAQYLKGQFSTSLNFKGKLDEQMNPNLMTFSGKGLFDVLEGSLANFEPLKKIGDALQVNEIKKLDIIKLKTHFALENGRVNIEPFDFAQHGIKMKVGGSHGLDQSLDYDIETAVPRNLLGSQANSLLDNLLGQAQKQGVKLNVPEHININLKLTGTLKDPKIATDFKDMLKGAGNDLKDLAKEMLENVKDSAKAVVDAAKAEINAKVDEVKETAKKEVDKAKEEVKQKLGEGTDSLKQYVQDKKGDIKEDAGQAAKDLVKDTKDKLKGTTDSTDQKPGEVAKEKGKDLIKGIFGKKK